jgi:16S rRNA (cytosine967-C5)-methyltransferase
MGMNHDDARTRAVRILTRVIKDGLTLDRVIPELCADMDSTRDRAFVRELCYGVLRWYPRLEFLVDNLLGKPLKKKELDVKVAMLCGLYQLEYLRTPEHAAVSASVEVAAHIGKPWARSVINAVLRRYQRESDLLKQAADACEVANFAHPRWLISALQNDWPRHWQQILHAANERPPMHLRVNLSRTSRTDYLQELARLEIAAEPAPLLPGGISLPRPVEVDALPGFSNGLVSVQDYGAQLAATLLDVRPGHAVLDACAAPGGKTAHIAETCRDLQRLVALDISLPRVELLHATRQRLNIPMEVIQADARTPETWWNGTPYDRILLDVPCSATGVIRRHPDIKLLRKPGDIARFAETQRQLLEAVWPLLKPGGKLVYATCSLLARENDAQLKIFTGAHPEACIAAISPNQAWGVTTRYGRQTLPGCDDMDGFYYAILEHA